MVTAALPSRDLPFSSSSYRENGSNQKKRTRPPGFRHEPIATHSHLGANSKAKLTPESLVKLMKILETPRLVGGKHNSECDFSIKVSLLEILNGLNSKFRNCNIPVNKDGIRLVGSAAAVIIADINTTVNDLDIVFYTSKKVSFFEVMQCEEELLCELIEKQLGKTLTPLEVYNSFLLDSLKVNEDGESWTLFSFGLEGGFRFDIKVVYKSQRTFAFSLDSFEIILNNILVSSYRTLSTYGYSSLNLNIFPSNRRDVFVQSTCPGSYLLSFESLCEKQISTIEPEKVRRGIFRYSLAIAKGNRPNPKQKELLEQTFVHQFFQEFGQEGGPEEFRKTLSKFVKNHHSNWFPVTSTLYQLISKSPQNTDEEKQKFLEILGKAFFKTDL